ncbi:hypothetical protein M3Y97_00903900 [Aphelenchoides bicaudatus]|nr:hypothetical protein M3Y97_00903900 [Aphelenchoides bicaudatus]
MEPRKTTHQSHFIHPHREYVNSVPIAQLACPARFMEMSFLKLERFAKPGLTSLDKEYQYTVWPENLMKYCPSLVDLSIFQNDKNTTLNEKDAFLLEDAVPVDSRRSQLHRKTVSWMKKPDTVSQPNKRYGINLDRPKVLTNCIPAQDMVDPEKSRLENIKREEMEIREMKKSRRKRKKVYDDGISVDFLEDLSE